MRKRSPGLSGRSAIAEQGNGTADLVGGLSPLARLALAYAPAAGRDDWLTLLALDARLETVVRAAREPVLAQLKLAWWRERLAGDPAGWPRGEPLLARLAPWADPAGLVPLVDGWEAWLGEDPGSPEAVCSFAQGRSAALGVLARQIGADGASGAVADVARCWGWADLALGAGERPIDELGRLRRLPRAMRPLAVLAGVSARAARRGGAAALYRPASYLVALRIGLLGA